MFEIIKKYPEVITLICVIFAHWYWLDGKFDELNKNISVVDKRLNSIETVLIMKNIMPSVIAGDK
jgi:hypothetical protein